MTLPLATLVFTCVIFTLFWLDRGEGIQPSKALWIPVAWLLINGSRPISAWLAAFGLTSPPAVQDSTTVYLEGSPIDRDVYICLLLAGLIVLIRNRQRVGSVLRQNGTILLFFSYCALSILWSDYPFVTFKHWTKGIGDLVMVLIVVIDPQPQLALRRLLTRAGFVLIPLSILLIKYDASLGRSYDVHTWTWMYTGVTTGKNLLGMVCLVFGLGSVWCFVTAYKDRNAAHRTGTLVAHAMLIAMVAWLFTQAHSMTSLFCFVMGTTIVVATAGSLLVQRPALVHFLVAPMLLVSAFVLFSGDAGSVLETIGRNPTLTGRTEIWKALAPLNGNSLMGAGYESFWLGDRLVRFWTMKHGYFKGIQEAHDGYFELFLNLGWIGVTLLGLIIITGYRRICAALQYSSGNIRLAYFVTGLIYSFTEAGFRMMFPVWIFFLVSATTWPEQSVMATDKDSPERNCNPRFGCARYLPTVEPTS